MGVEKTVVEAVDVQPDGAVVVSVRPRFSHRTRDALTRRTLRTPTRAVTQPTDTSVGSKNLPICGQVYRTFIERNVRTPYVRGEGATSARGRCSVCERRQRLASLPGQGSHTVVVSGPARGDQLPALLADASYTYTKELAETVFAREPAPGDLLLFNDRAVLPLHSPHPSGRRQTLAECCLARVAAQPSPSSATTRALTALRGHPDPGALVHTRAGGGAVRDMYTGLPSLSMWFGTLFTVVAFA